MNKWRVSEALKSIRQLEERVYLLANDEIVKAIELEESTLRRTTILNRLNRELRRRQRTKVVQST